MPPHSTLIRVKNHLRRKLLIGLAVFAPFALTLWIVYKLIAFFAQLLQTPKGAFSKLLGRISPNLLNPDYTLFGIEYVQYPAFFCAFVLVVTALYVIGLLSATFIGRRAIAGGESLVMRIPGAEFCYKTIKQVTEIVSMPRSQAFQKVVMIEYPRNGIRGLAFFSGITTLPSTGEVMVNIFIPTTPNPTSGFLLLMKPSEVWDTNLTIAEATRFIISGGVVELDDLETKPFPIKEFLPKAKATVEHPDASIAEKAEHSSPREPRLSQPETDPSAGSEEQRE